MQSITTVELRAPALMDCMQWSRHRLECLMACMPYAQTVSASTLPFSDFHRSAAASGPLSWHRQTQKDKKAWGGNLRGAVLLQVVFQEFGCVQHPANVLEKPKTSRGDMPNCI